MDSLNDIIAERNKSRMHKHQHNLNYQNILQSTPRVLRIQNSIDEEAVLIEKINMLQLSNQQSGGNGGGGTSSENSNPNMRRPNSR
jgi:hypothetical protein